MPQPRRVEIGPVDLSGGVSELDVGELRDPVDGEEHGELALGQAQFTAWRSLMSMWT